ncbi:MAG: hypothetical protein LBE10_02115 [Treponema sp.]|nr:hypothetical protein [Treponema sp.]
MDAKLEPLAVDGRSLAKEHLEALNGMGLDFEERKPIVICDRGYPSKDFIKKHVRNPGKGWNAGRPAKATCCGKRPWYSVNSSWS